MVAGREHASAIFPYILLRLPLVPRSALQSLAYKQTLAWIAEPVRKAALPDQAFLEDSAECDPEAVRLLQWEPFLSALREANPELGRRVANLPISAAAGMRKKQRQTVRAALRYWWRAALRPIPCGWLCGTALGVMDEPWPTPLPDLAQRKSATTITPSRIASAANAAWRVPAVALESRLFLSPICWNTGAATRYWDVKNNLPRDVPLALVPLLNEIARKPGTRLGELEKAGSAAALVQALALGLVEQYAATNGDNEVEALRSLLWRSAFEHVSLFAPLADLSPDESDNGCNSQVRIDSCYAPRLGLANVPGLEFFLREIGSFGAKIAEPVTPEARIAGLVLRRISPLGNPIPILEFYGECRRLAQEHGVNFQGPEHWPALAAALGIEAGIEESLPPADWLENCSASGAVEFPLPARWASSPEGRRRISIRFRRAANGPAGPRFHLAYFGGDRMSLFPRYERLPVDDQDQFRREVRKWMERWPEVSELYGAPVHDADAHQPVTPRVIHLPGTPPPPRSIPLGHLRVSARVADGAPVLIDSSGARIRPAFFGVAAEHALPDIARFALSIGNPEMTVLEGIARVLQSTVADCCSNLGTHVVMLPQVTLGQSIVLSPRLWLIPSQSLPAIASPVAAQEFVRFHNWLRQWQMPSRLAQASPAGEEPQWLDLSNPEGVNNFLRLFRSANLVILCGSFLENDEDGLASSSGWYEPEYYAEIAGS